MNDLFDFPDLKNLPGVTDGSDVLDLTQSIRDSVASKQVSNSIDVAVKSATQSGPTTPWRTFARFHPDGTWWPGTIISRRGKRYLVKLEAGPTPKWFVQPDILPYYYRYSAQDVLTTKPRVWAVKTGATKVLNIMVTGFASNSASVSHNLFWSIFRMLKSTLTDVKAPTTIRYSVYGYTDDVGGTKRNNSLATRRATAVLAHVKPAADRFHDLHRRAMLGKTFSLRHDQKAQPEAKAIAVANPLEKELRSNAKYRPNLRSVIITFRIDGASNFKGHSGGPDDQKLNNILRRHLDTVSTEPDKQLARLANVLLNEKSGSLYERYIETNSFKELSLEYAKGTDLRRWFLQGHGKSCWRILINGTRAKHDLLTVRKILKSILSDLRESRKRAKSQTEQGHGKGFSVNIMGWITSTKDRGVYGSLYIK